MSVSKRILLLFGFVAACYAGTIGSVVTLVGGASDLVLDEGRGRLYLVNGSQDRIEVYSILQRRFLTSIRTDSLPLSCAMSRSKKYLYVTSYNGSSLNVIDLDRGDMVNRISLPARPEGIAVGADERVLITTIGTGTGNNQNTLLVYNPNAQVTDTPISNVLVVPPVSLPPTLPPLAGRIYLANRSQLRASDDGTKIIGMNSYAASSRVVFVYDVPSAAVLKSRYVGDASTVLSIAPDGSKFMMGLRLFETSTLTVLAQMNAANAPFPLTTSIDSRGFTTVAQQFNLQQNQGGSVFTPNGAYVLGAFNIAPVQSPAARANVTQLFASDPDNLLILLGLQLPENLAGKMVISSDSSTVYALSDSGFTIIPMAQLLLSPIATPATTVALLANDQCGVNAANGSAKVDIRNDGRGRLTASATLFQAINLNTAGLGGTTGAGGGIIGGGGGVIVLPGQPGAGLPGTLPGGFTGVNTQQAQFLLTAPTAQVTNTPDGPQLNLKFNPNAGRANGTVSHDFLLQSPEAINILPMLRVFQNQRDPEAKGDIIPIPVGFSPNEGLMDMVLDSVRGRLYIANSGLNRVEVFDIKQNKLLTPIKVGQLPHGLALTPDANTLYVANTGGESVSIVDLSKGVAVGRVKFPPIPFNGNLAIITPSAIAATERGLQMVMSNGTLWSVVGNEAMPRTISPAIQTSTVPAPRAMTSTPNGEYALLLDGSGYAYLYDALADEYVVRRQVVTAPIQGYYGPIAAGPRGRYYLVNGLVLNEALTPTQTAGTVSVITQGRGNSTSAQTVIRPIPSVAAAGNSTFVRVATPARTNSNATTTEVPVVEMVDVNTGLTLLSSNMLEGPATAVVGNQRVNTLPRSMAVDAAGTTAYVLTTAGLSITPLERANPQSRLTVNRNGIVNFGSFLPNFAPNTLATIFGTNLATSATPNGYPLPTMMGGVCITMNNTPVPLLMTSPTQVNFQVPSEFAAGRYSLVIHSVDTKTATSAQQITLAKYAPAVLVDSDGQPSIFHAEGGAPVTKDNPAKRDHSLVMYAVGLGPVTGTRVTSGRPTPDSPAAVVNNVSVFFGNPKMSQSPVIVEGAKLVPGLVGIYQINVRIPGVHIASDGAPVPVTVRVGGVDSPTTGPAVPAVWVD